MWRPTSSPRRTPKSEASIRPPLSPRSTLTEVLRLNQFRVKNASSPALLTEKEEVHDEAIQLNKDLAVLANVFPDVKYECLREVLRRFDGDSRLEISTEQLYRYKAEWSKGRIQLPPREQDEPILIEDQFRTEQYRNACARLLYKEFTSLNKSAVDAVLAEVSYSYTEARPVLHEISVKSWRATLQSLFRRRKDRGTVPAFIWEKGRTGREIVLSGSAELDKELETLFLQPVRESEIACQEEHDRQLAVELNEREARKAEALYECQICYSDVPFEDITACTAEAHVVCLDCVRKSLNEAIFGQNWAQSVEPQLSTLKCLAPIDPRCEGHIPSNQLKQAVLLEKSGKELWDKFEDRLAEKAIFESRLPLVRCPFCSYAEAETTYDPHSARQISWSFRPIPTHYKIFAILACEFLLPTLLFLVLFLRIIWPSLLPNIFYTSLSHLARSQHTTRFRCLNPSCKRTSCLKCSKPFHDPHTCHEPLLMSLRQSVETARTLAIKRVCPRCGTSFVKSSGCNKLTCVCGYSMCYLCRKNIGKTGENEGAEGYRHFCEHFRPTGGKCTQCEKCDLYKSEEEDVLVRKAGEEAEREWRGREGGKMNEANKREVEGLRFDHDGVVGRVGVWDRFVRGDWTVQGVSDWVVGQAVVVRI
ncbi:hypothetical protein PMZ80_008101 [Knufia obscura]|uniref:RING-type domain-containing protein n=1 Tax=Knufia obscura TaxID=1635080 RepID=A0ABR0RGK6_9EURO|nr:hypothetical protein PMZ80_008101 [Knufia obscura]